MCPLREVVVISGQRAPCADRQLDMSGKGLKIKKNRAAQQLRDVKPLLSQLPQKAVVRVRALQNERRGGCAAFGENTARRSGILRLTLRAVLQYYEVFGGLSDHLF